MCGGGGHVIIIVSETRGDGRNDVSIQAFRINLGSSASVTDAGLDCGAGFSFIHQEKTHCSAVKT